MTENGGFIIEEALRKRKPGESRGMDWVFFGAGAIGLITAIFAVSFAIEPGVPKAEPGKSAWLIIILAGYCGVMGSIIKHGLKLINMAQANYKGLTGRVHEIGSEGCNAKCFDIAQKPQKFGAVYCGEEWLYSPFGILCR